jgi:hypothetical protein
MSEETSVKLAKVAYVEKKTLPMQSPTASSTAEIVLNQAMDYCAAKMGLAATWQAVERVKQGDGTACAYCRYGTAKQMAEALGLLDENIKAVYVADYDATPEDLCFGEAAYTSPIHLIVWVERKTSALDSLVEALDQALAECYAAILDRSKLAHVLDVQVVDDADVENRTGYGALLSSFFNRPLKVWER